MSAITLHLSERTTALLDEMASRLDRSPNELAELALRQFLTGEADLVAEVEAGLTDADQQRFATDEQVADILGRYGTRLAG